jgi:glycosyltransferase involved in cell wall biosynthesis
MNILSLKIEKYEKLTLELKLEDNVRFVGFQKNVEIYLKNTSLHILPSLSECYPMVLSETKIFGIPTILIGLDHLALAKGGTVIIYDDNPNIIAKEAIKIIKNYEYRKILGCEAIESMKQFKNNLIAKRWVELLKVVYKGDEKSFKKLSSNNKDKIKDEEANKILNNQLLLLQKRNPFFRNITLDKFKLYSF